MSLYGGGGSGSKSGGGGLYGSSSKKQQPSDDGFLGLGVGPSLHSIYKGVSEAPGKLASTAGGLATGLASTAWNTGKAGVNIADVGLANATGNDPSRYWNQEHAALHGLGQQAVGMVTGASSAVGDVADLATGGPLLHMMGQKTPGDFIRGTVGTGLADVGGIAAGKLHLNPLTPDNPDNVARLQQMGTTPGDFNQGSFAQRVKEQGYVQAGLADVGNLALVAKGTTPVLSKLGEVADGAGHSGVASALSNLAGASKVAEHPLKNTIGQPFAPLTRAAFAARTASQITDTGENFAGGPANGVEGFNHDPVVAAYHDQYGRERGMEFPGQVDTARTMPPELGQQVAEAYQAKPTDINELSPQEHAATQMSYDRLKDETAAQYEFLTKPESEGGMGVTVEHVDRANNPYQDANGNTDFKKMLTDIQQNKHLYVDKTSPDEAHPYLSPEENDQFRAVHDAFGHSRAGNNFGPDGEEVAYQHHSAMYSPGAQGALAMETRGQNATLNFSADNQARAAAGFPKEFDAQRVGLLPEEMSHPDYTKPAEAPPVSAVPEHPENVPLHSAGEANGPKVPHMPDEAQTMEGLSPTAAENTARNAKAIPEWATKAISKLGDRSPITKGLARAEDIKQSRTMRIIAREAERGGIEIPRRAAMNEPFMRTLRDAVQTLQEENPKLQPEDASRMIGQAVTDRLTEADKLEGGPGHHVLLPDEMRSPAIQSAIDTAEKQYPEFAAKTKEGTAASETHGDRGLPADGQTEPVETKQVTKLSNAIDRLTAKAEAAGRRVPREVIRLRAQRQALLDRIEIQGDRVARHEDIRNAAAERLAGLRDHVEPPEERPASTTRDKFTFTDREKSGRVQGRDVIEARDPKTGELLGEMEYQGKGSRASDPSPSGRGYVGPVDIHVSETARRQGVADALLNEAARREGANFVRPATSMTTEGQAWFDAWQAKHGFQGSNFPETDPGRPQVDEAGMPKPQTAAQMVRSTPAEPNPAVAELKDRIETARDRLKQLPTEAASRRGTSVVSSQMNDEITSLRQTIKDSQAQLAHELVHEPANRALNRGIDLAYSVRDIQDATQRIAEETKKKAAMESDAAKLQEQIDAGDTKSAKVKAGFEQVRARRQVQLQKALDTAPVSSWPRQYRPAGAAYMKMIEDAKSDPELKQLIGDAEPTWRSFLQHATALGMDPKYVADMTPEQVRAQMKVRPGIELGETKVSGARKQYNAVLSNLDARDNSIEAFVAARTAMHQEIVQNMMAGYMKDNFAVPIKAGQVISNDLASFDPSNKFQIEPREANGFWTAPKDGYVIPKQLAAGIVRANKDYAHWIQNANKFITNPWRNAVITASPQFYVNHSIGHAVLATIEGVHLDQWVKAWQEMRADKNGPANPDNLYNRFSGESAVGQGTSKEPTLESSLGVRDAINRTEGSKFVAGSHAVAAKLHAATNVVDSLARTATYISKKEAGYSDAEALNKAVSNLVDYNDLSPFEQHIVRAVVPFYSFQKAIFKIVGKFPVDHPAVLGVAANLGRVNQQQLSDRFGTVFPQGYAGLIDTGGGGAINTHGINPFKDATSLASAEGLFEALNPALAIALRAGGHAPSGGYVNGRTTDNYGNLVPDVNPVDELKDQASFLPFVSAATSVAGEGKGPIRGPLSKAGLNIYTPDEMKKLAARIKGGRDAAASGSPFVSTKKKSGSGLYG